MLSRLIRVNVSSNSGSDKATSKMTVWGSVETCYQKC